MGGTGLPRIAIITFAALYVLKMAIPVFFFVQSVQMILAPVSSIVGIAAFIFWIVLMLKAYQGELFKLPIVGDIAEKQVK